MGKKSKTSNSKKNAKTPNMIDCNKHSKNKNKSKENNIKNNKRKADLSKKYKDCIRRIQKKIKYNSLKIIFNNRRINEIRINSKIKKLLIDLYEIKLDQLTEKYNDNILSKYNCLKSNTFIR